MIWREIRCDNWYELLIQTYGYYVCDPTVESYRYVGCWFVGIQQFTNILDTGISNTDETSLVKTQLFGQIVVLKVWCNIYYVESPMKF